MTIESELAESYLDLMKKCLTRFIAPETFRPFSRPSPLQHPFAWAAHPLVAAIVERKGRKICRYVEFNPAARAEGRDSLPDADTMIGLKRIENIQFCIEQVLREEVPGDLIETGVWRGGACIFMRAVLKAYGDTTRKVWVADSFEGLPKPDGRYQEEVGDTQWQWNDGLAISLDQVKANFSRYGLLDAQVCFLKGWVKDTLPAAPIEKLAILRVDGDMYSSTLDSLTNLYPKLSVGGYVIIDDYGSIDACRKAVDDFRAANHIETPVTPVDWTGVYWKKPI